MKSKRLIRRINKNNHVSKYVQRRLLKEMIEADEKDGLYESKDWYVTNTGNSWAVESGGRGGLYEKNLYAHLQTKLKELVGYTSEEKDHQSYPDTPNKTVLIGADIFNLPEDPYKFLYVLGNCVEDEIDSVIGQGITKDLVYHAKKVLNLLDHPPTSIGYTFGAIQMEWESVLFDLKAKVEIYENRMTYQCPGQVWFDWDIVDIDTINLYLKELFD